MYDKIFDYNKSNVTIAYKDSYAGLVNVNTGKPITDFIYDIIEDKNSCNLSDLIAFEDDYNDNPYLRYGRHVIRNGDYFTMRKNNKWGLLDKNGKVIFDFKYRRPINLLGVFVIPGYYVVQAGRREGVLDKNSNIILEPVYDHIMQNKNYWSCEKNDRFGLADVNGNMVADIKYISVCAASFTRPCFIAQKDTKFGLITLNDEIISDFIYDHLSSENDGEFYYGTINHKHGVINYEGKTILDFKYDNISVCTNGNNKVAFLTKYKNKQELLDENGECLWKLTI